MAPERLRRRALWAAGTKHPDLNFDFPRRPTRTDQPTLCYLLLGQARGSQATPRPSRAMVINVAARRAEKTGADPVTAQ